MISERFCLATSCLLPTAVNLFLVQAVAAVFQEDTSAIVTLKESGIERPRELDGKRYATYGAKYEGRCAFMVSPVFWRRLHGQGSNL